MGTDSAVAGPRRRLPSSVRQQQVLTAAVAAFAGGGYEGTSTDQVAHLAGVSQPYVVRIFGGKRALFIAAHRYAMDRIENAFRTAVANRAPGVSPLQALQVAYLGLVQDRDLLRVMHHGFAPGADPVLGRAVRDCLTGLYATVRRLTGLGPDEACAFIAKGLLVNTLLSIGLPGADPAPEVVEMMRWAFGDAAARPA